MISNLMIKLNGRNRVFNFILFNSILKYSGKYVYRERIE